MFRTLAFVILASLITPVMADQRAETRQQLDQAAKDVAELKKLLLQLQEEKSGVQADLKKTETEMGDLEQQVKDLQQELKKSEEEIQRLDGVLASALVYQHADTLDAMNEEIDDGNGS